MASVMTVSAEEITFTLKCSVPNVITYSINGESAVLSETETVITANDEYGYGVYVNIYPTDDWRITNVTNAAGTPQGYFSGTGGGFTANGDEVYTINVYDLQASRTGSFTLNVDDPSGVSAQFSNNERLDITSTSQVVKYNPETENYLYLSSNNYSKPLYSVKVDGVNVSGSYGSFAVELSEGCVVDVEANYPDVDYTISLVYGEGAEGFFTGARVNYVDVPDFNGTSFTAKAGDYVEVYGNTTDYMFDDMTVNGENVPYFYSSYSFTVMGDTEIKVNAHKYGTIEFVINVDDPDNVVIYTRDQSYNEVPLQLNAGDNTISMSEQNNGLGFRANSGCYISSVTDSEGTELKESGSIYPTAGNVYTFVTGKIQFDETAVIYVDQVDGWTYFSAVYDLDVTRTPLTLQNGYNIVPFSLAYNPFAFSWYGCTNNGIYLNDVAVDPMYEGSTSYQLDVANNDVIKLYLAAEPVNCTVNFSVADDVNVDVTRDVIIPVTDLSTSLNCFNGTEIKVAGSDIVVKVNDDNVVKDEESGNYVFTVNDPSTYVTITNYGSGIRDINNNVNAADDAVFNLQGVRIGNRAEMSKLPAGLYIVGGQKVLVK